jgi:hypothetical protein
MALIASFIYAALVEKDVPFSGCPDVARDWWLGSTPGLLLASESSDNMLFFLPMARSATLARRPNCYTSSPALELGMFVSSAVSMTYRPAGSTIQALTSSAFAYIVLAALLATYTSE